MNLRTFELSRDLSPKGLKLPIDAATFDLVVFYVVHHAKRDVDLFAGGRDAAEIAYVLADEIGLQDGLPVRDDEVARLSLGIERDAVEVLQHSLDSLAPPVFLSAVHDSEYRVLCNYAVVVTVQISHDSFPCAFY